MNMPVGLKSPEDSRKVHSGGYLKGLQGRSFILLSEGLKVKQLLLPKLIDIPRDHGRLLRQGNIALSTADDSRQQVGINVRRKET